MRVAEAAASLNEFINMHYMCGGLPAQYGPASQFEPMLLGIVVPDSAKQAFIVRSLRELTERLQAQQTVPSLRRGNLT